MSFIFSVTGCQTEKKPSILIIAIDRLSFNSFACSDDKSVTNSGLSVLCREALRFTHAYTTSTQSAAAVGSLLTGLYPYQHQLHRSFNRIDYKTTQLQTLAGQNGYRTAFWSGGPSILKKTGLSKDFEVFDDSSFLEKKNYFSNLKYQTDLFLNWSLESKLPYFATIYNSELENLNEGESEISSFEKIDETLAHFFDELKKNNLWENNYIVVTGLQGQSIYSRLRETPFSNLHSENTHVLLFVKPPRQKGDEGVNWKIDSAMTLADLGYSLMKTIAPDFQNPIDLQFPVWDFSQLWLPGDGTSETFNLNESRHLILESANTWKSHIEARFAVLYKNLIYLEDSKDEVYNVLTDGLETIDLSASQKEFMADNQKELSLVRAQKNLLKWTDFRTAQYDAVLANREYWSKPNARIGVLESELKNSDKKAIAKNPLSVIAVQTLLNKDKNIEAKLKISAAEKEALFSEARRQSLNLSLENIWGIWSADKEWLQSDFIKEYQ
ncbi:MAG: sulfatase-like hydrolase/transferase [Bdellovibrio sp.]|nr:sulfatase-like hydrolase/transferase [Bdellovibrio sp.]